MTHNPPHTGNQKPFLRKIPLETEANFYSFHFTETFANINVQVFKRMDPIFFIIPNCGHLRQIRGKLVYYNIDRWINTPC